MFTVRSCAKGGRGDQSARTTVAAGRSAICVGSRRYRRDRCAVIEWSRTKRKLGVACERVKYTPKSEHEVAKRMLLDVGEEQGHLALRFANRIRDRAVVKDAPRGATGLVELGLNGGELVADVSDIRH